MATYYVSSVDGSDASDGSTWTDAKATVAGALAVATTTGDVILVDSAHNYSPAGVITWNASSGVHVSIISTDRTNGGYLAGATETVGATSNVFNLASSGAQSMFIQGMTVSANSGANSTNDFNIGTSGAGVRLEFLECTIKQPSSGSGSDLFFGPSVASGNLPPNIYLTDCTIQLNNNTGAFGFTPRYADIKLLGCTFTLTSAVPSVLINPADSHIVNISGCDFSAWSGATVINATEQQGIISFANCKFHASSAFAPSGTWPLTNATVQYVNCDDADTTYQLNHYSREGAITVDLATYASDSATVDGNALSWKIDTTADADEDSPFVTPWVSTWIDSTGSKTLSLELLYDSASNYDDREIWAEIEYLGNASFPLSTVYSSRNANPFTGSGADLTAGSATWTEALTNDNKDKITTTVTVNGKGLARARLYVAVASTTIYLDPQLRVA